MRDSKSPLAAIRTHWRLVLASAIVLMLAGYALAAARPATYTSTATARLLNSDADRIDTSGTTAAAPDPSRNLATQAVLIEGDAVVDAAAKVLKRDPEDVRNHITVTQSQFGDTIDITADGTSAAQARALAEAVSSAFVRTSTQTEKTLLQNAVASISSELSALKAQTTDANVDPAIRSSAQQAYDALNITYTEKQTQLAILQPDVVIVRTPDLSGSPSSLSKGKSAVLGLVLGLLFGTALAVVRANTVDRVLDEDDLVEATGLRVLALVPEDSHLHISPVLHGAGRTGAFVDAVRRLHHALPEPDAGGVGRSVLITGDAREQGRSILAANLAYTAGQSGARVILAIADMRSPGADTYFDAALHSVHSMPEDSGDAGLADLLRWCEATAPDRRLPMLRQRIPELLLSSEGTRVQTLTAGRGARAAIDLIQPRNLAPIIQVLTELCDLVIIDAPTFTTPEAMVLAGSTDLTLLAVSVGKRTASRQRLIRRLPALVAAAPDVAAVALTARGSDDRRGDYPEHSTLEERTYVAPAADLMPTDRPTDVPPPTPVPSPGGSGQDVSPPP